MWLQLHQIGGGGGPCCVSEQARFTAFGRSPAVGCGGGGERAHGVEEQSVIDDDSEGEHNAALRETTGSGAS